MNGSVPTTNPTIVTLASGFSLPTAVALDANQNIYISDTGNERVKEIMQQAVNFGSLPVATSTPTTLTLPFTFDSAGTISAPAVLTQGATGLDFTDAGTGTCTTNGTSHNYEVGDTCTVDVIFTPTRPDPTRPDPTRPDPTRPGPALATVR